MSDTTSKSSSNSTCDIYHEQIMTTANRRALRVSLRRFDIMQMIVLPIQQWVLFCIVTILANLCSDNYQVFRENCIKTNEIFTIDIIVTNF